jgi:hypothetical protein
LNCCVALGKVSFFEVSWHELCDGELKLHFREQTMLALTSTKNKSKALWATTLTVASAVFSVAANAESSSFSAQNLLSQRAPAPLPASPYSANLILGLAFQAEDLTALLNASGSAACYTGNEKVQRLDSAGRGTSRACIAAVEQTHYERISFANDRFSQALLPNYAPNAVQPSFIQQGAVSRLTSRFVTRTIARNELLKIIVEGKIDVNLSLRDLSMDSFAEKFERTPEARPTYRLQVQYRNAPASADDVKVAAVGNGALVGLKAHSSSKRDLPIAEKKIVEVWPEAPVSAPQPVAPVSDEKRFTKTLQKKFGLSAEPFSNFRLRLERAPGSLSVSAFALRLEDASGVANLDLTGLVRGNIEGVAYKFRVPYGKHSAVLSADNLAMKNRYLYEYAATSSLRTRVAYDPNSVSVSDAWSGRYSVGFSLTF